MESSPIAWWERLRHRLRRSRYLALHLLIGWLLSLALLGLFVAISQLIGPGSSVARWDEEVAARAYQHREASPNLRQFFVIVTEAGSARTLTWVVIGTCLVLLLRRRRLLLFICVVGPLAGGIIDTGLKDFFERPRPLLHDPSVNESSMSFPSGHSMGSVFTYGLLAYSIVESRRKRWWRWFAVPGAVMLVLLIGLSRIYLNAHYPTDVLGGWTVGAWWLAVCITAVESIKIHHHHRQLVGHIDG
jgi:undecaprenyl-diphosphatase